MSRLFTPLYVDYPNDTSFVFSPSDYGPGTLAPWRLNLETNAGRKGLDVVIASKFRITSWLIQGSASGDSLNETQTASLPTGSGFGDERELAVYDWFLPASPSSFTQYPLILGSPTSWGVKTSVNFSYKIYREGEEDIAYVGIQFEGSSTPSSVIFSTTQYSIYTVQSGSVTFKVPGWGLDTQYHSLTTPLFSNGGSVGTFTCTGVTSLPYADGSGNPVWNPASAGSALNPLTAHVNID